VFAAVEQEPEFKNGGQAGFNAYLAKAVKFPAVDRENGTSGRVIVTFVVERDGSLTDVKALRGPDQSMEDAAVAAVKSSPSWKPGVQNGQKVRVQFTISFAFSLADADQ
jgi:protein TonB